MDCFGNIVKMGYDSQRFREEVIGGPDDRSAARDLPW